MSYEKCATQMNNIDDYKKARNKLNRWKPKNMVIMCFSNCIYKYIQCMYNIFIINMICKFNKIFLIK